MEAIIKLSSLGDIIHSLIVLPKLNKKVDFFVDNVFKEILEYNPFIENIVPVKLRQAKKQKSLYIKEFVRLKSMDAYERVYDLQGLIKSALLARLVGDIVVGFKNPREKIARFFYDEKKDVLGEIAIRRYINLFGFDDTQYLKNHPKLLFYKDKEFEFLSKTKKNIVFIIGASWECKKTPLKIWDKLAKHFKNENIIIPYYGESEKKDAFFLAENNSNILPISLNLNALKALIDKCDLLIGNDTGPSFIAWANNINNVILYGCTYNNKIYENKFSKSVEMQKSIKKGLMVMDKMDLNQILKKIDEF
ncbi:MULTISPECIES: glycosyltransferase family 9 protein [unclassified Lebetimonas]|uniref:glycosyltransferase family 9 protein n=1 Tax=unclassified Lebetimonas TaxID=2648158 RepID=UPI0004641C3E|nr:MULTISPECIES: glycosyltransferase family 9 protein [unclassified Lebetimonas]